MMLWDRCAIGHPASGFEILRHHCTGCRRNFSRAFFRFDRAGVLSIFENLVRILLGDHNEAPRSSLLRRSSHFATKAGSCGASCEILRPVGQSLWAACRSHYPPSPRLRRALPALPTPPKQPLRLRRPGIPLASCGVFGEGE